MKTILFNIFLFVFLLSACGSPRPAVSDTVDNSGFTTARTPDGDRVIEVSNYVSLADLLSRMPGLYVSDRGVNTQVSYRGRNPLFVLDGIPLGYDFRSIDGVVSPQAIAEVELYDPIEATAMFGRRGGNGAIEVRTSTSRQRD